MPSNAPGPAGPVTCHLDLSFTAPLPVLAGPHALAGVAFIPQPPSAPSEDYLRHSGRLPPDTAMLVLQSAAVVPFSVLVTLSSALPRPFLTFEGPGRFSRAPSLMQGPRKLLPARFPGSLVVAWMGF